MATQIRNLVSRRQARPIFRMRVGNIPQQEYTEIEDLKSHKSMKNDLVLWKSQCGSIALLTAAMSDEDLI